MAQPPHLYFNDTYYFITAHNYLNQNILKDNNKKQILLNKIQKEFKKFNYLIFGWAILNNHYHLLFKTFLGKNLPKIFNNIHGFTSFAFNKIDKTPKRQKVWENYFDRCIRDKKDFYKHLNYIHQNPIKHGLIKNLEGLNSYQFCSYKNYLNKFGKDWLDDCFERYPIIDFVIISKD